MNIPKEALDAASERLLGTADSPTGWLSDLDAHADSKNGLVWAQEPGAIDVWHTVKDVLEAALPHIEAALRTQIAAEDNSGRPDAIDPDWREKIAIALQERKAARQQKGTTK